MTARQKRENVILLLAGLFYALLYVIFWPSIYSTMDEGSYMGNAYVLRHGTIYADVAETSVVTNFLAKGHFVSKYPLGMAALLSVTSFLGWPVALGVNLLIHLLTFVLVIRLLRYLNVPAPFALLYLLHPTAVLYSRTVMSDLASGLLITLAFDSFIRGRTALCGFWSGLSLVFRTGNIVALLGFGVAIVFRYLLKKSATWQERLLPAVGFALCLLPFLFSSYYYASVIANGQMAQNTGSFALRYFPSMFPAYVITLLLLYPGLLLAPALYRGPGRIALTITCYGFILLYSFWFYRDSGSNALETLIVGQRYFLAVLPLLIVAYAKVLWNGLRERARLPKRVGIVLAGLCTVGLFGVATAIHFKHSRFLGTMSNVRDSIVAATDTNDRIYGNIQVAKLFHPGWGQRHVEIATANKEQFGELSQWLATPSHGRVALAYWIRPGRQEDERDAQKVIELQHRLEQEYAIQPSTAPHPKELFLSFATQRIAARQQEMTSSLRIPSPATATLTTPPAHSGADQKGGGLPPAGKEGNESWRK